MLFITSKLEDAGLVPWYAISVPILSAFTIALMIHFTRVFMPSLDARSRSGVKYMRDETVTWHEKDDAIDGMRGINNVARKASTVVLVVVIATAFMFVYCTINEFIGGITKPTVHGNAAMLVFFIIKECVGACFGFICLMTINSLARCVAVVLMIYRMQKRME
jgi:Na+-driven multidrug efflux pump